MNPIDQFEIDSQKIRLSEAARLRIRTALATHAVLNPVRIRSPYFSFFHLGAGAFAFAALLLVIATGGTAFAAEGALPGDALYGIKVSVVEPVEGAFQATASAQADWQVHLASTRLEEAEALADTDKLEDGTKVRVAARVAASATAAAVAVDNLATTSPAAAATLAGKFDATITLHQEAIADLAQTEGTSSAPVLAALITAKSEEAAVPAQATRPRSAMSFAARTLPRTLEATTSTSTASERSDATYTSAARLFARVHILAEDH